jgi:hypothetical protein
MAHFVVQCHKWWDSRQARRRINTKDSKVSMATIQIIIVESMGESDVHWAKGRARLKEPNCHRGRAGDRAARSHISTRRNKASTFSSENICWADAGALDSALLL